VRGLGGYNGSLPLALTISGLTKRDVAFLSSAMGRKLDSKAGPQFGADATLHDWVKKSRESLGTSRGAEAQFSEWVTLQPVSSLFCTTEEPGAAEVQFVRDHVQGMGSVA
jgi:hypothetical protein